MSKLYTQIWKLHDFSHPLTGKGGLFISRRGPCSRGYIPLSYKYLCKECGEIYAEIKTLDSKSIWTGINGYCKEHGSGIIIPSYKTHWYEHAPHAVLLHDFLLLELFDSSKYMYRRV